MNDYEGSGPVILSSNYAYTVSEAPSETTRIFIKSSLHSNRQEAIPVTEIKKIIEITEPKFRPQVEKLLFEAI